MDGIEATQEEFDLFLSHASPDREWVLALADRLEGLGLRVFVDVREIVVGDNFVVRLSDALERSRYMVLVLSDHTVGRPWVLQEWTSFMAGKGPLGRLLPVAIDAVELPAILASTHTLDALDRDVGRAGDELFKVVGDPSTLKADDARRLVLGRDLVFTLSRDDEHLTVAGPDGAARQMPLPWKSDASFGVAVLEFGKLHRHPLTIDRDRADLFRHARVLGGTLFEVLFEQEGAERLQALVGLDRPRPVVQIRSDDDLLLSLPWELVHHEDRFLVREGVVDLIRTTPTDVAGETLLREPKTPFKLVVNVSAPEGSRLSYEAESYRITLATADRCEMVPTELGTLEDLLDTVDAEEPTGIHFSGHGAPGALQFEDDEGREDRVEVGEVVTRLRRRLPDARRLPPFFYLASCHGNDPVAPGEERLGAPSAAVQLHKAGVTQVVGYFGPIVDELSTRAEETIYEAIAEGRTTRDAVRLARDVLARPFHESDAGHRHDVAGADPDTAVDPDAAADTHPFAWAQLVLYHRGPEWPLSVPVPTGIRRSARALRRHFEGFGDRRILDAGFIGRRLELHKIRRRLREGDRVLVLQGLGGLGKSTLAQRVLPWLTSDRANVCTLWCQEVEAEGNRAEALVGQLLEYCRRRFGPDWESIVQQVDQAAGGDSARRFVYFLHALVQNAPGLVLYLDNLESLLVGPQDEADPGAFGQWAEPDLESIWANADQMASDSEGCYLIASCRYRNDHFTSALLPVTPLPDDALFRLTEWFPALQRLSTINRARLVERLDGHPRAVEYANDLVADALATWRDTHGEWVLSTPPATEEIEREWAELVEPCLPEVADKLTDNLLLQALWDRVLDESARRFLYRMTVLRRPVEWDILGLLGEPEEPLERALDTAQRLRTTSLLQQVEVLVRVTETQLATSTRYALHPATVRFVREAHVDAPEVRTETHHRLGTHLESAAKDSPYIETDLEAGHHLFEAGEYDRAYELLGTASDWLRNRGRVREALQILEPFLEHPARPLLETSRLGRLLGSLGLAHARLGEIQKAIGYYEQRIEIARSIGDRRGEGTALGNLGIAYSQLGEIQKAIGYYEQHLEIARSIGDRRGEGNALGNLGNAYSQLGEIHKAIGYYEQTLEIARSIGDRHGEGTTLGNLGNTYLQLDQVGKAKQLLDQAKVIGEEIGDPRIVELADRLLDEL